MKAGVPNELGVPPKAEKGDGAVSSIPDGFALQLALVSLPFPPKLLPKTFLATPLPLPFIPPRSADDSRLEVLFPSGFAERNPPRHALPFAPDSADMEFPALVDPQTSLCCRDGDDG